MTREYPNYCDMVNKKQVNSQHFVHRYLWVPQNTKLSDKT